MGQRHRSVALPLLPALPMPRDSPTTTMHHVKVTVDKLTVHTERTFAIARGSSDSFERVVLTLDEGGGAIGRGEAAPTDYYGQDAEAVAENLEGVTVRDS